MMIDKTILHYKILDKLGEGGMGVVYKASDTKLKRDVAIKFLPTHFAKDSEQRKRFELEAKAAASLNHPNIATIYGVEELDGETFIVMEYVRGQSLRQIVDTGPLKLDDAIKYATQIAEGLQVAHKHEVVHRDIKSANIMVDDQNQVKIMDFGLAKLATQTLMTRQGTTLGTAAYMSPEQAKGETIDPRTDIWSLGVVLYEMISGQLPFKGDYEHAVIYTILNEEPEPLTALRTGVPIRLDHIVSKALAKDKAKRYQHVDELPVDLKGLDSRSINNSRISAKAASGPVVTHTNHQNRVLSWVLSFMIGVVLTGLTAWLALRPLPLPVNRWNISLPISAPIAPIGTAPLAVGRPALAISPDGSKIVYVADSDGTTKLYLRSLEKYEVIPIPGTEDAYHPFFAPDGQWVGFFAGNELKKISLAGGAPVSLCSVPNSVGATWGADDKIVFSSNEGKKLWWVSTAGGEPHLITDGPGRYSWPEFLPDGKAVIVNQSRKLLLVFVASGKIQALGISGSNAKYVANKYLLYNTDGRLEAIGFDADKQVVTGAPVPVLDGVRIESLARATQCSISRNGTVVYLPGDFEQKSNLVWLDRSGHVENLPYSADIYGNFQLSPDGQRLAISIYQGDKRNVWLYNLTRQSRFRLTLKGSNSHPVWSPEGKSIAFKSNRTGQWGTFVKSTDRKGEVKLVYESEKNYSPNSWSPNGKVLVLDDGQDIWSLPMDSTETLQPLKNSPIQEWAAAFSPDGHWVAYTSDEQGQFDVYVEPYPPTGESVQVSTEGGEVPVWSHSSNELFYRYGQKWMVASFTTSPTLSFEEPQLLFEGNYLNIAGVDYDVSPDGQRFLLLKPIEESSPHTQLNIITNWFEELRHKMTASK
jgi:serine/threonine protein kinase/Tol biopolymer transport system component